MKLFARSPSSSSLLMLCLGVFVVLPSLASAEEVVAKRNKKAKVQDERAQVEFFEAKIRPVLVAHCYECHAASTKNPKGGLLLDTREGIRRGGESGHAVVPGDLDESLIISSLKYESFEMPPQGQLPSQVIKDFERWISMGAHDPRDGKSALVRDTIDFESARDFWAFQPLRKPSVPMVKNESWLRSDVDAFIAQRLESKGIEPVADAAAVDLVRRIYFDLIGVPPTPKQADQFIAHYADNPDAAIASLVDELLGNRMFGERWGRHWLDVVRFAESTGMERNGTYPQAWRYRDWVIDAMNQDKPYDQFVTEQIAGDWLPFETIEQRNANLIATGMLAIGPKSLNENNKEQFQLDVVDEQIDVVTRAFLGLTASCARCHDHKFDPIPQSEYYALAGIFTSTETLYGTGKTNGNRNPGRLLAINGDAVRAVELGGGDSGKLLKRYEADLKKQKVKLAAAKKQLQRAKNERATQAAKKAINLAEIEIRRLTNRIKQVTVDEVELSDATTLVMAVKDSDKAADTRLRIRGEPRDYGSAVPRGFLTIASLQEPPQIPKDRSGRLELAQWITDPANPLTSRVIVNRVWQHLFGRGLVVTVNNFGFNGDRPTHPLLLDYLASDFNAGDGSIKQLIRRIMTSRVYRLSATASSAGQAADPDNDLLSHMNQRRLEAEAIRDAMLKASGQLDLTPVESSIVAELGLGIVGQDLKADQLKRETDARSVYLPIVRSELPEILRLFDFPEPSIIGGARDVTTVPTQALFMMNNEFVVDSARRFAERLLENENASDESRVRRAYRLALVRQPSTDEIQAAVNYIRDVQETLGTQPKANREQSQRLAWASFCQTLFASSEFRYLN